jgi:hypothetical protein
LILVWLVPLAQVWIQPWCQFWKTYRRWISRDKKYSKFSISPHLKSKYYEITSKKSHSPRVFQYYRELASISLAFLVLILLNFLWQNCSIFNNSSIICLNIMKQPQCTLGFPKVPRAWWGTMIWEISTWQIKLTNNLP